jgi:hypothetical protein
MSPAKPASPVQQPRAAEQWHAGGPLTASSSGSTGVSKLFTYQRDHVIHAIEASAAHFGWPTGRAFTAWTPLAPQGIGARMMVWRDRVRILTSPAGAFEWLGRIDNVINTGGVKVQPERLEALLAGAVKEAGGGRFYIVGRPHPTTGQQVVLVLAADDPADEHTILSACAAALPSLLHPQRPRAIERRRLMYTATGKICRN